jgi:hypothetical protein
MAALDYARFMEALRKGWLHHSRRPGADPARAERDRPAAASAAIPASTARTTRAAARCRPARSLIDALIAAAMVHTTAAADLYDDAEADDVEGLLKTLWHAPSVILDPVARVARASSAHRWCCCDLHAGIPIAIGCGTRSPGCCSSRWCPGRRRTWPVSRQSVTEVESCRA